MKINILLVKFLKSLNNYIIFLCYFIKMLSLFIWFFLVKVNLFFSNKIIFYGIIFFVVFYWRSGGRGLFFFERRNNIIVLYFVFEIKCWCFWNFY